VPKVCYAINEKFRQAYGMPAIVSVCLNGAAHARTNFHYLDVNYDLFDLERRVPVAGVHYNFRDVFCPRAIAILDYLAGPQLFYDSNDC